MVHKHTIFHHLTRHGHVATTTVVTNSGLYVELSMKDGRFSKTWYSQA